MTDTMQNKEKKPSKRKYIIAAASFALLIIGALVFIVFTQKQNPDPASEKIIRQLVSSQLKKAPDLLTDEDFAKITELEIEFKELSDIKLLEKFTNLQELNLAGIKFPEKDIPSWMKMLSKLGIFNLSERFNIDLSPLTKLSNLQNLSLSYTQVSNLEPLRNLTNLKTFHLIDTQVSNLEPLGNLTNLQTLELYGTQVSNLEPLRNLSNLQTLYLLGTIQVSNLEPLKGLKNLTHIYIMNCPNITDEQVEELQKALPKLRIQR